MKAIEIAGTEVEIFSTNATHAGAGHKKITVELYFQGEYKRFSATTTDMPAYDEATDLEGEDKDDAFANIIAYKIEDSVSEWINEILEN